MVHVPRLISREDVLASTARHAALALHQLDVLLAVLLADQLVGEAELLRELVHDHVVGRDSNSGSITFSRHWIERFEAVTLPEVSNCVAAGSR